MTNATNLTNREVSRQDGAPQNPATQPQENQLAAGGNVERYVTPRASVVDTPDAVMLELEMPGVDRDKINIVLNRDELTITGVRRTEEYANAEILHQERPTANFRRQFLLSERIDGARVAANYENGILRLTLPKAEDAKPRKIAIQ